MAASNKEHSHLFWAVVKTFFFFFLDHLFQLVEKLKRLILWKFALGPEGPARSKSCSSYLLQLQRFSDKKLNGCEFWPRISRLKKKKNHVFWQFPTKNWGEPALLKKIFTDWNKRGTWSRSAERKLGKAWTEVSSFEALELLQAQLSGSRMPLDIIALFYLEQGPYLKL